MYSLFLLVFICYVKLLAILERKTCLFLNAKYILKKLIKYFFFVVVIKYSLSLLSSVTFLQLATWRLISKNQPTNFSSWYIYLLITNKKNI